MEIDPPPQPCFGCGGRHPGGEEVTCLQREVRRLRAALRTSDSVRAQLAAEHADELRRLRCELSIARSIVR